MHLISALGLIGLIYSAFAQSAYDYGYGNGYPYQYPQYPPHNQYPQQQPQWPQWPQWPQPEQKPQWSPPQPQEQQHSHQVERPYVDPQVIEKIFTTMPQIPSEFVDALYLQDPGFVKYVISQHENLQGLLVKMHPDTLDFVHQHVPSIEKTLTQLSVEETREIISSLYDIKAFLAKLDPETLKILLFKMPEMQEFAPSTKTTTTTTPTPTTTAAVTTSTTEAPVTESEYLGPLFTREELEEIRAVFPRVDELLSNLSNKRQIALITLFPNMAKAITNLDSKDLKTLNDNVIEIAHQLNNLNAESLVKIVTDKSGSNILQKILS